MDIHSMHTIFIALHAASGVVSFITGSLLISLPRQVANRRLFGLYAGFLSGLVVFLAGAILVYWGQYSTIERILFPSLFGLGLYMLYRAGRAYQLLGNQQENWEQAAIEHIGFTLISLFEGFIIVTVLNSGGPAWLVALVAPLGVVLGRWAVGRAQRRVMPRSLANSTASVTPPLMNNEKASRRR